VAQTHSGMSSQVYARVVCVTYQMSLSPAAGAAIAKVEEGSYLAVDDEVMIVTSMNAQVCLFASPMHGQRLSLD
jgi:hypothetical protein